jgi:hypothetical protein
VDNPRAHGARSRWKVLKVESESVDQGARVNSARRVNYKSSGFVHDDQSFIFVNDVEWDVLGSKCVRCRSVKLDFYLIAKSKSVGYFRAPAVYDYVFILNKSLETCTTPVGNLRREVNIKSYVNVLFIDFKREAVLIHR